MKRYVRIWRNKWLTATATSIGEVADKLIAAGNQVRAMADAGVELEDLDGVADDYITIGTDDPEVAQQFHLPARLECVNCGALTDPWTASPLCCECECECEGLS